VGLNENYKKQIIEAVIIEKIFIRESKITSSEKEFQNKTAKAKIKLNKSRLISNLINYN
jgi:hypothetical protein